MANGYKNFKFWAGLVAVTGAVTVLLCLGFWQVQRLEWKHGLMAALEAERAVDAATVNLAELVQDPGSVLKRGYLAGRWDRDATVTIGPKARDGTWGNWLLTPLVLENGTRVMVNRGWSETIVLPPAQNAQVMGLLRAAGKDRLPVYDDAAPLILFMEDSIPADKTIPVPPVASLRNEHKQYAIFWFAMAFVLVAMYGWFSLRGKRSASSQGPSVP